MRVEDAPRAGWYPDPEGGVRLRWWDGVDWSERWRSRPASQSSMNAVVANKEVQEEVGASDDGNIQYDQMNNQGGNVSFDTPWGSANASMMPGRPPSLPSAAEARQMFEEARRETIQQAQYATQQSIEQVRRAASSMEPLIGEYATKANSFLRKLVFVVIGLMIVWFVLQALATQNMWNWIGDRIDNLNDGGSLLVPWLPFGSN